jgi:hypothetical protein
VTTAALPGSCMLGWPALRPGRRVYVRLAGALLPRAARPSRPGEAREGTIPAFWSGWPALSESMIASALSRAGAHGRPAGVDREVSCKALPRATGELQWLLVPRRWVSTFVMIRQSCDIKACS